MKNKIKDTKGKRGRILKKASPGRVMIVKSVPRANGFRNFHSALITIYIYIPFSTIPSPNFYGNIYY